MAEFSESLKVVGGKPLSGEITVVPNKNSVLPAIALSILTDQKVYYKNIPETTDVKKMLEMLKLMGAEVDDENLNNLTICCKNIKTYKVDKQLGNMIRASVLFAGPLLARFGKAEIPVPGGCVLGQRSINAHIDAFKKAEVNVSYADDYVTFTAPKKIKDKYDVWFMEASVTATENLAIYAAGVESVFEITEAASEPHVSHILLLLKDMGAKIKGLNSNKVTIKGSSKLTGTKFVPEPDHIDIAGLIVAAGITKGKLTLKDANIYRIVGGITQMFTKFGIKITESGKDLIVDGSGNLKIDINKSGFPMGGNDLPKIAPRPWPGFPVDALPGVLALSCKAEGRFLFQNWMYETGLDFVNILNSMGANIFVADPQRVIVSGPVNFKGGKIDVPRIIQATKAIFLASLADPVETTLVGTEVLKRRYPDVIERFNNLGANIRQIS